METSRLFPTPHSRNLLGPHSVPISPLVVGHVGEPNVVSAAFDAGINTFFVSADMHWPIYESLRRGLAALFDRGPHVRQEVCVMVVSYVAQPEFTVLPFREVLESVPGLGHIDVTVIGGAYAHDFDARLDSYQKHRLGSVPGVRATAAAFHDRYMCSRALTEGLVDLGFVRYNPSHRNAKSDVFAARRASGVLLYNFNSTSEYVTKSRFVELGLMRDYWYPEVHDYYRFALTTAPVDGLLCSFRSERELQESLDAIARGPLSEEECQFMLDLADLDAGHATLMLP